MSDGTDASGDVVGDDPGPAPRRVGLRRWFGCCPWLLQLAFVVQIPGVLLVPWIHHAVSDRGVARPGVLLAFQAVFVGLHLVWAWRVWTLVRDGVAVQGTITKVERPEERAQQASVEVDYAYEMGGARHEGFHTTTRADLLERGPGTPLWLIVDPRRPGRSMPWGV